MSPSWIERRLGRACRTVVFQRRTVRVATGWRWRGHFRITHQAELALPDGFLEVAGRADPKAVAALAAQLREAAPACPRHVPVWVALPDAVADIVSLPLQRGLSDRAAQSVMTGRLQRELGWPRQPRVAVQRLMKAAPKDLWLATALDADLQSAVESALRQAGMAPWAMRPAALWRLGSLLARMASGEGGAWVGVDDDGPSVACWDADRRVRWCHARWEDGQTDATSRAELIRRICLQYVQADPDHRLQALHLLVHDEAAASLADRLDACLQHPCRRHVPPAGVCVTASAMAGVPWVCPWPAPPQPSSK